MKASGLSQKEIAALMGHASDASATIHYARKTSGMKVNPPSSPKDEVKTVKEKSFSSFLQKLKAKFE